VARAGSLKENDDRCDKNLANRYFTLHLLASNSLRAACIWDTTGHRQ